MCRDAALICRVVDWPMGGRWKGRQRRGYQSGDDQSGDDQRGGGRKISKQMESNQSGSSQKGSSQKGSSQKGSSQKGTARAEAGRGQAVRRAVPNAAGCPQAAVLWLSVAARISFDRCIASHGVVGVVTHLRCVARPASYHDGTAGLAQAILLRQLRLVVQAADNPTKSSEIKV